MSTPMQTQIPRSVQFRLTALKWSIRSYVVLESLAIATIWLGVTFWLALAVDYLPVLAGAGEMPFAARVIVLLLVGSVLGWLIYRWLLSRTLVHFRNDQLAVLLERRYPDFRDALLTVVELNEHPDHADDFSGQMLEETNRLALEKLPQVRLRHVFRMQPLGVKLGAALLLAISVVGFSQVKADAFGLWVRRLYLLDEETWPRRSQIRVTGLELIREDLSTTVTNEPRLLTFHGHSLKLAKGAAVKVLVEADARKVVPKTCTIHYRTHEGDRGRVTMKRIGQPQNGVQRFEFEGKPFRGVLTDLKFDVRGGDHRVRDYQLRIVDSPKVVLTKIACEFPDYLSKVPLPAVLYRGSGLQLAQGTKLTFTLTANKSLKQVVVSTPNPNPAQEPLQHTIAVNDSGSAPSQWTLPAVQLGEQLMMDVQLYDRDGVYSDEPHRIVVTGVADQPPRVKIALKGIGTAITPDAKLPFVGTVEDDYGVARQWFEIVVDAEKTSELEIEPTRDGKVLSEIDFRALQKAESPITLRPKDKISVTVLAADRYNLEGGPNIGQGDRFQLDVVTPDELLGRLDRRELELRRRFEQIIDEMTQLRDTLARVANDRPDDGESLLREPGEDATTATPEQLAAKLHSLNTLRAQRAVSQADKSAQEIVGVSASFDDIRLEIANNRIDAADRQERLRTQICEPLDLIVDTLFSQFKDQLRTVQKTIEEEESYFDDAQLARQQTDEILIELDRVLQKMLELEDYNALVQLVRRLIDDQKELSARTKALRKKKALELLK